MAIVLASINGKPNKDILEYYLDDVSEVENLPTNTKNKINIYICTGSSAYVVNGGKVYLFSETKDSWIEQ